MRLRGFFKCRMARFGHLVALAVLSQPLGRWGHRWEVWRARPGWGRRQNGAERGGSLPDCSSPPLVPSVHPRSPRALPVPHAVLEVGPPEQASVYIQHRWTSLFLFFFFPQ